MAYRRDEDLAAWVKNNWWLVIVLFVGIGVWLNTPLMQQTGADSVDLSGPGKESSEQSLRTLDDAENPQGAPGSTINMDMPDRGAYARSEDPNGQASSLYQAPGGAAGAPVSSEGEKPAEASGESSLAAALKRVGDSVTSSAGDHSGWGGQAARTGFSASKGSLSRLSSRSGGGGSSSASYQVINKAFGLGGNPGLVETRAPDLKDAKVGTKIGRGGGAQSNVNQNLEALKSMEKSGASSLLGNTERAAGMGQKTFDAAAGRSRSIASGAGAGGAGVGVGEGDVPANLKANDYSQVNKKDIQPPPIQAAAEVKSNNNQQMMMMMMMMMMGGMLGPSFSAMAPAMMMGMSMSQ
ncbi:MAG TPA: hypothetical protein DCM05_03685 [Elusimicrobia bacterium]|nr:hypothetical protein [Elusimicrobiota bacterium]